MVLVAAAVLVVDDATTLLVVVLGTTKTSLEVEGMATASLVPVVEIVTASSVVVNGKTTTPLVEEVGTCTTTLVEEGVVEAATALATVVGSTTTSLVGTDEDESLLVGTVDDPCTTGRDECLPAAQPKLPAGLSWKPWGIARAGAATASIEKSDECILSDENSQTS